jgi:hypothetical protein
MFRPRRVIFTLTVLIGALLPATDSVAAINHNETLVLDD